MKLRINLFLFGIICLAVTACNPMAKLNKNGTQLSVKLAENDTYTIISNNDMMISMEVMENAMSMDITVDVYLSSEVEKIEGDTIISRSRFDRMVMSQNSSFMQMYLDTDDPSAAEGMGMNSEMVAEMLAQITDTTFTVKTLKNGKIVFNNSKEVLGEMGGNNQMLSNSGSYQGVVFPDRIIRPGDKWIDTMNINNEVSGAQVITEYTLIEYKKNIAFIAFASEFSGEGEQSISGTQKGTSEVDITTGLTLNTTMTQNLDMTISQEGFDIPMNIKGKSTLSTNKKE